MTTKLLRVAVLAQLLALVASCTPDAPEDQVDAAVGPGEREVACVGTERVTTHADGSVSKITELHAVIDPPFDWRKVTWRLCDLQPPAPAPACPTGDVCTGERPAPAFCVTSNTVEIIGSADGPGRIYCGITGENISAGGITTRTGQRYMRVTVFGAD